MSTDPILMVAGEWLGAASGVLALATIAAYVLGRGFRFRLVGVTSFTALLAVSCLAFAVSYRPRVTVAGAVSLPVVFDNGAELVVAAAPADLPLEAAAASAEQVALNLRGNGRQSDDASVRVRVRRVEGVAPGVSQPVILAEVRRDLMTGEITAQP
jgi:hypothetical protein